MNQFGGIMLFGLGAPKAGTSWMHGYLAEHPEVFVPPIKEMHFFNSVDGDVAGRLRKLNAKRSRVAQRLERQGGPETDLADLDAIHALTQDGTDAAYLDFMTSRAGTCKVMADITPAYGLLSVERLLAMQSMANSRFIYLMRDPVARIWSNIRMNAVRKLRKTGGNNIARVCKTMLDNALAGKMHALQARADYASVLGKLAQLDPKKLLVAFYEDLFTNETVTRICDFLEIAVMPADFGTRINEGKTVALADADRARAAAYLKPQYAAAEAYMGRLPASWKQTVGVA